mgnify:CR=1 FL=1
MADLEKIKIEDGTGLINALVQVGACKSNREARDLINGSSIMVNGNKVTDMNFVLNKEDAFNKELTIIRKGKNGEVYNVGSGKSFYIRDMIGTLVEQSAAASDKTKLPVRLDDNQLTHYRADISKLSRDTGFEPEYDINDTLVSVLEAYRNRYV